MLFRDSFGGIDSKMIWWVIPWKELFANLVEAVHRVENVKKHNMFVVLAWKLDCWFVQLVRLPLWYTTRQIEGLLPVVIELCRWLTHKVGFVGLILLALLVYMCLSKL